MNESWDILVSELALHGFRLVGNGMIETYTSDKQLKQVPITNAISFLTQEIKQNKELLSDVFEDLSKTLTSETTGSYTADQSESKLFIFSLKDIAKFLEMFEDKDSAQVTMIVRSALEKDILQFDENQIKKVPDCKIAIDWIHRLISRLIYIRKMLFFASKGKQHVMSLPIKTAKGVTGPWGNLDVPIKERMWSWEEEDSNFRSRDKEIRKQRRYRKGLENYNGDGRVGEGHYWRELRNEPFLWSDRATESPYPYRSVLTNWG